MRDIDLEHHLLCLLGCLGYSNGLEVGMLHSVRSWIRPLGPDHGVSKDITSLDIADVGRWGNEICTDDNEERAIVVGSMNEVRIPNVDWRLPEICS